MYPYAEAKTSKRKAKIDHLKLRSSHQGHVIVSHHYMDGSEDGTPHVFHTPDSLLEHITKHMGIKWGEVGHEEGGNEAEYREE